MNYIKLVFDIEEPYQELIIAELLDMDFYGFEQKDERLIAYVEQPRYNDSNREYIEQVIAAYPGASFYESDPIAEQNWNEAWEKTIQPQIIGNFLVRPTWSGAIPEAGMILLEIDPKMAFGTGYHATTRLMLRSLSDLNFREKEVLDAGTGTGILAIAAAKLGAKKITAFDNDPWSRDNAVENIYLNGVSDRVEFRFGGMEVIDETDQFDITLANINRNTILDFLPDFIKYTRPEGTIMLSGLLDSDEPIIREKLQTLPVTVENMTGEGEWICYRLRKS